MFESPRDPFLPWRLKMDPFHPWWLPRNNLRRHIGESFDPCFEKMGLPPFQMIWPPFSTEQRTMMKSLFFVIRAKTATISSKSSLVDRRPGFDRSIPQSQNEERLAPLANDFFLSECHLNGKVEKHQQGTLQARNPFRSHFKTSTKWWCGPHFWLIVATMYALH